mmetsp:Transcript_5909/g.8648  ORF Transcript_5909/g.8648 Transcript_5909/m.8648 type:complete len:484 (+) Transcript_5909:35-1486(+)
MSEETNKLEDEQQNKEDNHEEEEEGEINIELNGDDDAEEEEEEEEVEELDQDKLEHFENEKIRENMVQYMESLGDSENEAVQMVLPMLQYFMNENKALRTKVRELENWQHQFFNKAETKSQLRNVINKTFVVKQNTRIIAFVNSKSGSGSQYGQSLMGKLKTVVGKSNVYDITAGGGPYEKLLAHMKNTDIQIRCLVCGGDGSVAWVLEVIDQIIKDHPELECSRPYVCIVPFGTGNDLSRVLGWGGSYSSLGSITLLVKRIKNSSPVKLDRWLVKLKGVQNDSIKKDWVMNNYFSIGIDAQIALKFHNLREESPHLCASQTANKFWYLSYGLNHLLKSDEHLDKSLKIWADGKEMDPKTYSVSSLIFNNIPSYSAGTQLWKNDSRTQKIDDSLLEVIGVTNTAHLAQIKAGVSNALNLHQAHHYRIEFNPTKRRPSVAMQVDGEPFLIENKMEVEITFHNQGNMLVSKSVTVKDQLAHVGLL